MPTLIENSLCVFAMSTAPIGNVTYRGVHTLTHKVLFHKKPMTHGTENIGTFLAIVHGLAYLQQQASDIPVYTSNAIALRWIQHRNIRTQLTRSEQNTEIFSLLDRAIAWLRKNNYNNNILLWGTQHLGPIPADFNTSSPTSQKPSSSSQTTDDNIATINISGNTYKLKEQFKKVGMTWKNNQWIGQYPLHKIEKLKEFCRRYNLTYTVEGKNIRESRLARGHRPISGLSTSAVMGEGNMQWAIEETINIEKQRNRQQQNKK